MSTRCNSCKTMLQDIVLTRLGTGFNNVTLFSPWPPESPDMNPIENLWAQMETALNRRANRPRNEHQLWNAVREEWARVDMFDVRRLVFSMRRRCTALVQAAGNHTRY